MNSKTRRIQFSVSSISCVACAPAIRKGLRRTAGIRAVSELPMLNTVVVEFDPAETDEARVREEIFSVAEKAGFKGKVIMPRREVI